MTVGQRLVAIILTFVGRQVFVQVLAIELLGVNSLFADVLMILSIADMGLATAMTYSYFKPLAENDEDKLAALSHYYNKVYKLIALAVALIGIGLTPFLRYIINVEHPIPQIEIYYLIALASTVVSYLFVYKTIIIKADQKAYITAKYRIWMSITASILQIGVLLLTRSFLLFNIVLIFTTLGFNLLISRKANQLYPFLKRKVVLDTDDKRSVFKNIKSMIIYHTSGILFASSDTILISVLIGTVTVGKYSNYMLAVLNLKNMCYMVFNSMSASIGNMIVKEPPKKRLQIFNAMQALSCWLSGFVIYCSFFLLDDFVILWLGRDFVFDLPTKVALLLTAYFSILLFPTAAFRVATGMYQKSKYVMAVAAITKILLAIILGIHFGLPGILAATVISKLATYAWYEPKILYRDFFENSSTRYFIENTVNLLIVAVCIIVTYYFFPWWESSGWFEWIQKGVVYTLVINSIYFIRYFRTPEFKVITDKLMALVMKKPAR